MQIMQYISLPTAASQFFALLNNLYDCTYNHFDILTTLCVTHVSFVFSKAKLNEVNGLSVIQKLFISKVEKNVAF